MLAENGSVDPNGGRSEGRTAENTKLYADAVREIGVMCVFFYFFVLVLVFGDVEGG